MSFCIRKKSLAACYEREKRNGRTIGPLQRKTKLSKDYGNNNNRKQSVCRPRGEDREDSDIRGGVLDKGNGATAGNG
ncbi:hypothetical protein VCM39_13305 [Bacteroides sp. CG01]|uniref:hypothetical protein n=1 Tax=Bacteroides sp. CG01 TaxID=3096000 RepID=UPI002B002127|nr:hypothetical protein [Bacteroides sp. CG01]